MYKKLLTILLCFVMVFSILPMGTVSSLAAEEIEKPIYVVLNGNQLEFDVKPAIINNRVMVPMRTIFEAMGMTIDWNESTQKIIASNENTTIELVVGNENAVVNGETVKLDSPAVIVDSRVLVPTRFIAEATGNSVYWDTQFAQKVIISKPLEKDILDAVNRFENECFGEKTFDWVINLYDPETGGFYFKKSAKDTEGFLPDRESTLKCLKILEGLGAIDTKNLGEVYDEEMLERLLKFAQEGQDPENLYWYEEPWGKHVGVSKMQYETSAANQLIAMVPGGKPLYTEPATKEDEEKEVLLESEIPVQSYLAASTGNTLFDNRFNSKEDFKAWFDSLPWEAPDGNAYAAGSQLLNAVGGARAAGEDMFDYMVELTMEKINPNTGFLSRVDPETGKLLDEVDFDSMSGSYKAAGMFVESWYPSMKGKCLTWPYYEKAIDSVMQVMLNKDQGFHACDVANAFVFLRNVMYTQKSIDPTVREKVYTQLPQLIDATRERTASLMCEDGGYSYYAGKGADGNQGHPHGTSLLEGEISGTSMILISLRTAVYRFLGFDPPAMFGGALTPEMTRERLQAVEPTKKIDFKTNCELTFDDVPDGPVPDYLPIRSSGDVTVCEDREYVDERALRIHSPGGERPVVIFDVGTRSGKGFTLSYDIKFETENESTGLLYSEIGSYRFAVVTNLRKGNGSFVFSRTTDASKNLKQGFDGTMYHNIKIVYMPDGENAKTEYYFDGKLVDTSTYFQVNQYGAPPMENIPMVMFRADHESPFTAYIDNFKFSEHKTDLQGESEIAFYSVN
ncbi:MAG: copper amine oxidase N-terminal domain-containing protein [Clostridia bacterium]|nr:copper amine oxidase N-terminal domain-containing protein [Clostridia bacterium]